MFPPFSAPAAPPGDVWRAIMGARVPLTSVPGPISHLAERAAAEL